MGRRITRMVMSALAFGGIVLLACATSASAGAPGVSVERSVSIAGAALYEYEALLHSTFGSPISVCTGSGGCHEGWFYRGARSPMSEYSRFTFVFAKFGTPSFHLMAAGFNVAKGFGDYSVAVKINGRLVACNSSATQFLISNGDALGDGNLGCLAPR